MAILKKLFRFVVGTYFKITFFTNTYICRFMFLTDSLSCSISMLDQCKMQRITFCLPNRLYQVRFTICARAQNYYMAPNLNLLDMKIALHNKLVEKAIWHLRLWQLQFMFFETSTWSNYSIFVNVSKAAICLPLPQCGNLLWPSSTWNQFWQDLLLMNLLNIQLTIGSVIL